MTHPRNIPGKIPGKMLGKAVDFNSKDVDGWREVVVLTPLEGSQLRVSDDRMFDVSIDMSLFDSIALWMTLDTFIDPPDVSQYSLSTNSHNCSNTTNFTSSELDTCYSSNTTLDTNSCYDYFRPNMKWSAERILRMIAPNMENQNISGAEQIGSSFSQYLDRYEQRVKNGTFVSDPEIIKMIADICRKLNLHIIVYDVEPTLDKTVKFETVFIGKIVLEVKPRSSFSKAITSYGMITNPRKVAIAHNSHVGCQRRYSLIASGIATVPAVKLDSVNDLVAKAEMCIGVNRYYIDVYREFRTLVESVAEFVFKDLVDEVCTAQSISVHVSTPTLSVESTTQQTSHTSPITPITLTAPTAPTHTSRNSRTTEICNMMVNQISTVRENIANLTKEIDDLFEKYNEVQSSLAKEKESILYKNTLYGATTHTIHDDCVNTLEVDLKQLETLIKRKKIAISVGEDTIKMLIQRVEAFQDNVKQKTPPSSSESTQSTTQITTQTTMSQTPKWRANFAKHQTESSSHNNQQQPYYQTRQVYHNPHQTSYQNPYQNQHHTYQPRHHYSHTTSNYNPNYSKFNNQNNPFNQSGYQPQYRLFKERRF